MIFNWRMWFVHSTIWMTIGICLLVFIFLVTCVWHTFLEQVGTRMYALDFIFTILLLHLSSSDWYRSKPLWTRVWLLHSTHTYKSAYSFCTLLRIHLISKFIFFLFLFLPFILLQSRIESLSRAKTVNHIKMKIWNRM